MADDAAALRALLHRLRNQLNAIAVTADLLVEELGPTPLGADAEVVSSSAHEAGKTAAEIARLLRARDG